MRNKKYKKGRKMVAYSINRLNTIHNKITAMFEYAIINGYTNYNIPKQCGKFGTSKEIKMSKYQKVYNTINYDEYKRLMDSTKNTINAEAISLMKDGVVILNFARDILCDEKAVLDGIASGKVRKYVSDFANPTTAGQVGCIVTSHLGASTEEAEDNCAKMAVDEMRNFLENGNIINSVNYPNCDMGVCSAKARVTICHKNTANMITKFTATFGDLNINIENMMNKSKGNYAYTIIDVADDINDDIITKLNSIDGVIKVRAI
jgi:D-3-phosphoglycerate dehydrogenase